MSSLMSKQKNKTSRLSSKGLKSAYFQAFLRVTGLEPARRGHQNLNLARLPIPPHPLVMKLITFAIISLQFFFVNLKSIAL